MCLAALCLTAGCSTPAPAAEDLDVRIGFGLAAGPVRDQATRILMALLYSEPLLSLGWDGRPTAMVASGWNWEDEGRTLLVRVRPGVKFHDGEPITSSVLVPRLDTYREAISGRPGYAGGFRHVTSIAAVDDHTVAIHLSAPDTFLLDELSQVSVVSPHDVQVGTGPFRIVSSEPATRLERFEGYHRGEPSVRSITITPFDSQRSAWAALMRGEIDAVQEVERESVEFLEGSTQVKTYSTLRPFYFALVFNARHNVLGTVEVRRALSEAVDRDEIIQDALRGHAQPAHDPIWPAHWAYSAARRYTYNPEAARLRLDRAGLPVRPVKRGQMASRFQITCLFSNSEPQFERMALLLQRQFARVGVDLRLTGMPLNQAISHAGTGTFDLLLVPIGGSTSLGRAYEFWRSPVKGDAILNSGYTGADTVFDHLRSVRSDPEIRTAMADLQQRFYEDAPAVFIAWQQTTRAVDARIDVSEESAPDVFANIWRWRTAAPGQAAR